MAADEPKSDAPIAAKADKAADADVKAKPAITEAAVELRSTIGHGDSVKPAIDEPKASAPLREQTRTADAGNTLPASKAPVTMSDATSTGSNALPATEQSVSVKDGDTSKDDATPDEVASSDDKPAGTANESVKADEPKVEAKTADVKTADVKTADVKIDDIKAEAPKAAAATSSEKSDESSNAASMSAAVPPATKDQARPAGIEKAAGSKPDPATATPKRSGQIAMFVSRKDSKLYVRQNFTPLFDVPVTIASSDRPLGTHVFTAQVDKDDANVLHWSVVSLPVPRVAQRNDEDERASRRRKIAGVVEVKSLPAPDSAAEALDRLNLPADAMAKIAEALSTGGSIIVSDQGIAAGETGEGTDFIVSLR
jgi:hypothetical protein